MNRTYAVTEAAPSPGSTPCDSLPASDTFVIGTSYVDDTTVLRATALGGNLCSGHVDDVTCALSYVDCETTAPNGDLLNIDFSLSATATGLRGTAVVTSARSGCRVTYEETGRPR